MRDANDTWIGLISSNAAYRVEVEGMTWWGYRYFKHPLHYKTKGYNLMNYDLVLNQSLTKAGVNINLKFNDHYKVTLIRTTDEWVVSLVHIEYKYH